MVKSYQDLNDDVYSLVARMSTLKLLLSLVCKRSWFLNQLDFETAFLNGKIESEVFIEMLEGFRTGDII